MFRFLFIAIYFVTKTYGWLCDEVLRKAPRVLRCFTPSPCACQIIHSLVGSSVLPSYTEGKEGWGGYHSSSFYEEDSRTTASSDLAKYSTLLVLRPAMEILPFFVM